ncbi:DUF2244 domain-containing protein [Phenylobacterium sp.]|uniref:DUF2244 domain-containing protein n=1 Tax=Phenylobacterium sp. TaxID=1871053 RepID=UPI002FD8C1AF
MHGAYFMDAVITPNRSLSQRGFVILIAVITGVNALTALIFLRMGATLVPIFLGLDVVAITVAFLVSFHAARQVERVQVTAHEVRVLRQTPRAQALVWTSPTAFTRVGVEVEDEETVGVKLMLSGKVAKVAAALSPRERADFARALESAIWRARRARY